MVLSDRSIKAELAAGRIVVDPCNVGDIQPSSIDLHLGSRFQVFRNSRYPYIDPMVEQRGLMEMVEASVGQPFVLHPGEFVLGATIERVRLPHDIVARLEGSLPSGDSVCSSTLRRDTLTRAGKAHSPSSSRTWPTRPSY